MFLAITPAQAVHTKKRHTLLKKIVIDFRYTMFHFHRTWQMWWEYYNIKIFTQVLRGLFNWWLILFKFFISVACLQCHCPLCRSPLLSPALLCSALLWLVWESSATPFTLQKFPLSLCLALASLTTYKSLHICKSPVFEMCKCFLSKLHC